MKCPICNEEFESRRSDAETCQKSACRKKMQRLKKKIKETPEELLIIDEAGRVPNPEVVKDLVEDLLEHHFIDDVNESYEEWLARRIQETGSGGSITINLGYPPGSSGTIAIPAKWGTDDIEVAIEYHKAMK